MDKYEGLNWPGNGIKYVPPQPKPPKSLTVGECINILSQLDKNLDAKIDLEEMKAWACKIIGV